MSAEFRKTDLPKVCMKRRQKSLYKSSLSFPVGASRPLVSSGDTAVQSIETVWFLPSAIPCAKLQGGQHP